ncbi:hypothetical protein CTEN210_11697 [Chaetoceros tenuissimus]|uniref:Peptidase M11 gametolysin domain-containing protein n=1 Tax=Chaetoceros tenuissimus TaxID=426638 RepID=A0AAD3D1S3_9STRA|nr:hypothetical protein CTEN210_11697 [Chaetoceros tenuissimus]
MNTKIIPKTLLFSLTVFAYVVAAKDHHYATNDQLRLLRDNIFAHRDESPQSSSEAELSSRSIPCTIEKLFGLEPQHGVSLNDFLTCATKDGQYYDVNLLEGLSCLYHSLTPEEELIIHVSEQKVTKQHSFQLIGHMNDLSYTRRRKEDSNTEISSRNSAKARNTSGIFKLLVVRVLGKGIEDDITQSEEKLFDDFFGDSSNVRTRMMKCSNNKLIFDPATGDHVNQGVLSLRLDENLKGNDFLMVSTMAMAEVSWYQTDYASNAFVQVHEISHNFGFNHSGKGSDEFGDSTDSTGNIGQWLDDGPVACFNGAKTYYSGWYPEFYSSLDPGINSFSEDLVGLNDIVSKPSVSTGNNLVSRLSTIGTDDLFIMYQRAEGILDTLQSNRDTVTITQQKSFEAQSWSLAELRPGQEYRYENYGGYGRPLIVKFCSEIVDSNDIDKAHVIAYVEGLTVANRGAYMDIPDGVTSDEDHTSCSDTPLDFIWRKQRRNCKWVAAKPTDCCSSKVLSSMCPQTCMTCDKCVDGRRRFYMKNGTSRACYWASSRNTVKRCKVLGIAETCRKTCGQCS